VIPNARRNPKFPNPTITQLPATTTQMKAASHDNGKFTLPTNAL
jgi:hypothetical protein